MGTAGNAQQKAAALGVAHFTQKLSVDSRGAGKTKELHCVLLRVGFLPLAGVQVGPYL